MSLQEKLKECQVNGTALLATNFYNFETLEAVLQAAKTTESSLILQASEGTLKYLGVETTVALAKAGLKKYAVKGWLHLDHGSNISVVKECLEAGFDSVMIDASEASIDKNIEITKEVVKMAANYNANVEAELGYIAKLGQSQEFTCTSPQEAKYFAETTGINALAVAIGNAHGFYKKKPKLHFDVLKEISDQTSVPLVLHGGSGIPNRHLQKAIQLGVCKINLATEIKNAFMRSLQEILTNNEEIDLRQVFPLATAVAKELVSQKLKTINHAA